MRYFSKGLRRRGDTDKWEVTLTHKDPLSGEIVRSYHTVTARTEKQARKRRGELVRDLESRGLSAEPKTTESCRMIPLTPRLFAVLEAMRKEAITPCGPSPDTLDPIPACS